MPVIKTFASVVSQVSNDDLSGGLVKRDTIVVSVGKNGTRYEVGPDAYLLSERTTTRVLNNNYIETEQYMALLHGALLMMDCSEIDLLVLSLPVNNMVRAADLKDMALNITHINDKTYTIKNVWVICQPLAGYLSYANELGQEGYNKLKDLNVLSLDFGFITADWLTSCGVKVNEKRSGAVDMGMSVVLDNVSKALKQSFTNLDAIPLHLIDEAFWKHPGYITISGRKYPFPVCDGIDIDGKPVRKFDVTSEIRKVVQGCLQAIRNNVGAGADISLILVMGGAHQVYLDEVKNTYPDHEIVVVSDPLIAVCKGMYFGGVRYMEALAKQNQAKKS